MGDAGESVFDLKTKTDDFMKGMDQAEARAKTGSASIGKMLGPALGGAIGAGLGAGVGVLGTSFNQLDASMAQLSAQTGVTGSDLNAIKGVTIDLSKSNLQSQAAIAGVSENLIAMQGVNAQNKEEVRGMTEQYLKFSTATGLDAVQSVKDFDAVLDAWGGTAADGEGIMDRLIVSHQRFGTNVQASTGALNTLAPTFTTLGMSMDDAISYLNLFEASGIDAASTSTAFSKAVVLLTDNTDASNKKLETIATSIGLTGDSLAAFMAMSPAEKFKILSDSISKIEDPTLRAQVAIDLFGAKAGPKLSAALSASGGDISAFSVSVEEAAGATDRAAAAIEGTLMNRLKLLGNQIKGTAMSVTKDFAPAFQIMGAMGVKPAAMIGGLTGALGGMGKTLPMVTTAARGLGMAMMTPPLGIVVAVAAAAAIAYLLITHWDDVKKFFADVLLPALQKVGEFFMHLFEPLLQMGQQALAWLKDNWPMVAGILLGPIGIFAGALAGDSFGIRTKLLGLFQGAMDAVTGLFGNLGSMLAGVWNEKIVPFFTTTIPNFFKDNWTQILIVVFGGIPGILFTVFHDQAMAAWNTILSFFTSDIPNFFTSNWQTILLTVFGGIPGLLFALFRDKAWEAITGIAGSLAEMGSNIASTILGTLSSGISGVLGIAQSVPGLMWQGVQNAMETLLGGLRGLVGDILSILNPMNWFGSPGLVARGEQIPDLIWQGVLNAKDFVIAKVTEWAGSFPDLIGKGLSAGADLIGEGANAMLGGLKNVPGVDKIPGPWSTLFEAGLKIANEVGSGIAAGAPSMAAQWGDLVRQSMALPDLPAAMDEGWANATRASMGLSALPTAADEAAKSMAVQWAESTRTAMGLPDLPDALDEGWASATRAAMGLPGLPAAVNEAATTLNTSIVGAVVDTAQEGTDTAEAEAPSIGDAVVASATAAIIAGVEPAKQGGAALVGYAASGAFSYAMGEGSSMFGRVGEELIAGMIRGLDAAAGTLYDRIREIIDAAIAAAQEEAGAESPSTKFAKVGGDMAAGLLGGWGAGVKDLPRQMGVLNPTGAGPLNVLQKFAGQQAGPGKRELNVHVYNPRPEAAEDSLHRKLLQFGHLGAW
jgi:TP901 family phage tail tape measure protein